ncbi:MAG: ribonuclease H-like YkuK family protein [Syntrophomonadaceae bacterium]|nr:ribonuclease H-like YkuK family protein [Syntrophomonadaceae bacterium]MDD3024322.1 ribonuclease H-like YkuK family protein [Syntrophomonadaceae bacterium]
MNFISPSKGSLSLIEVVKDMLDYISEDLDRSYKIIVGSDSHSNCQGTCFVSAIIIHRQGKGARYYYDKFIDRKMNSLRQRIFYEASLSLALADQLSVCLKDHGREDMKVEIHLDAGVKGETKELIKELTGMIIASGFAAKIKPDACAASKVADKYTK